MKASFRRLLRGRVKLPAHWEATIWSPTCNWERPRLKALPLAARFVRLLSGCAGVHKGSMRILLVEDDDMLGGAVRDHLAANGHAVDWVKTIGSAADARSTTPYGLILLDLGLPDGNGLGLLRALRRAKDRGVAAAPQASLGEAAATVTRRSRPGGGRRPCRFSGGAEGGRRRLQPDITTGAR